MMEKGATTVWELWNGDSADPAMNSGNHVMLVGNLVIWLYENVAGIRNDPRTAGFKRIVMHPTPVAGLQFVRATHRSPHGFIESAWKSSADRFECDIRGPVNTTATVYIPAKSAKEIREGGAAISRAVGVKFLRMEGPTAVCEVKSGAYHFVAPTLEIGRYFFAISAVVSAWGP